MPCWLLLPMARATVIAEYSMVYAAAALTCRAGEPGKESSAASLRSPNHECIPAAVLHLHAGSRPSDSAAGQQHGTSSTAHHELLNKNTCASGSNKKPLILRLALHLIATDGPRDRSVYIPSSVNDFFFHAMNELQRRWTGIWLLRSDPRSNGERMHCIG
jgi:hypothetical protein